MTCGLEISDSVSLDNEGVAVILCDIEQERKYKALVAGTTLLESCLHVNLSEHLNSEIGLGTITNVTTAQSELLSRVLKQCDEPSWFVQEWLRNSFMFQRIQKNPRHYALGKANDQTWQSRLDELVESSIRDLQENSLVTNSSGGGTFASTEYGEIMSKVRPYAIYI
jgi:ATP-dependent DNA helicase HFM1/MER3